MATIVLTVTNDLTFDQRMQRICTTLAEAGYQVELVGRELPRSLPLDVQAFRQKRLRCRFHKGFLFYAEYSIRLWAYLMRAPCDAVCSVDLDTLPAGCVATLLRRKKRMFDAHEYFTEVPEVVHRPVVRSFWEMVARIFLPFYRDAYTVGPALAAIFEKKYGIAFGVVRNMPGRLPLSPRPMGDLALLFQQATLSARSTSQTVNQSTKVLLYQGALNAARGIEQMLKAMQRLEGVELWLAGEGDLSESLRKMAADLGAQDRVRFLGYVKPADLKALTAQAWLGINVLENTGLSYYYSLANKFFDYVQAGVPVLTMNFPEYRALNAQYEVAILLDDLSPEAIEKAVRELVVNPAAYERLSEATLLAREQWNWENERQHLLRYWRELFARQ
ncbi:MAG: glycosyltransferase [Saprospiraceae bacterium]|jgi:glycosyltransferase involved in cell wall biosynthesis|nr:glycosyltransferase [Saprospiraceae bacterium]